MVQVNARSNEAKLLKVLLEKYPVDDKELMEKTGLSKLEVERALKGMEARGWVKLDRLPDRTYVRMNRFDFTFLGRDETQRKAVKHKSKDRKKRKKKQDLLKDEIDDMMYA
jgi:hypothetical protein